MSTLEINELKLDMSKLKNNLDKDMTELNNAIKDIAVQYHELKHDHADMCQGVVNTQQSLIRLEHSVEKLLDKITGDEKWGNLGIVQVLKNQEAFNAEIHKRVKTIEEVEAFKEKVSLWKKGIFITLWIGFGGFLAGFAKAVATFFINLFI